jgi:LytS/YehU family sensor histidine kinase
MVFKYKSIYTEIIAWIGFLAFQFILFCSLEPFIVDSTINPMYLIYLLTNSLLILFFYLHHYLFLPKYFFTKKYTIYSFFVFIYLFGMIILLSSNKSFNPFFNQNFRNPILAFNLAIVIRFTIIYLFSFLLATNEHKKKLEKIKLNLELHSLKIQINPHFLFNTLNNIYSLVITKSDLAAESITRLSAIMRYMIKDTNQDFVLIENEISYIKAYIELEKLRLTNLVTLSVLVTGNFSNKKIAPMLFLPFIENVFKHGVSNSDPSNIIIKIVLEGNDLIFEVFNTKVKTIPKIESGFGIENIQLRLNLLYPEKHLLIINNDNQKYQIILKLKLND